MGLKKHGNKKCLLYDGLGYTLQVNAKLVAGDLVYTCRSCGEVVRKEVVRKVTYRKEVVRKVTYTDRLKQFLGK